MDILHYIRRWSFLLLLLFLCGWFPIIGLAEAKPSVPVLVYHRVGTSSGPLTVTPERFAKDLDDLRQHGYETISLPVFEDYVLGRHVSLPAKPVLITFDDSYRDNYENAFPILRQHHSVAAFFVITWFTDKNEERLTSQQIREMAAAGMSFGSHTALHVPLAQQSEERMECELVYSKEFLDELLGTPSRAIAYPQGSYNAAALRIAGQAGYTLGFTVEKAVFRPDRNQPLLIPRVPVFRYTGSIMQAIQAAR